MNTLVTGAAGFVGSHTAKALTDQGHTVIALDSLIRGKRQTLENLAEHAHQKKTPFHTTIADIHDTERLANLIAEHNITTILHFAALAVIAESIERPLDYHHHNAAGTVALLRAAHHARQQQGDHLARAVVLSSTCAVYGNAPIDTPINEDTTPAPTHPYGRSKLAAEHALEDFASAENNTRRNFKAAALRYFNAAGADPDRLLGEQTNTSTRLIPSAALAALGHLPHLDIHGTNFPTPDGTAVRDYIHVAELASAHLAVAAAMHNAAPAGHQLPTWSVYNLGSGRGHSVRQAVAAVERAAAAPVPTRDAPRRPGDPANLVADPKKFEQDFLTPAATRSLDEQAADAVRWIRAHPHQSQQPRPEPTRNR